MPAPRRLLALLAAGLLLGGCARPAADPHAAGRACADCHAAEAAAWGASDHARAHGPVAHPERFDGVERAAGSLHATPLVVDGRPAFRVRDAAGTVTWPAVGVIGVAPLQQVRLDAGRGRQVIAPLAWDVGAGRWFDPAPEGAVGDPADPLYWAGLAGNWNHLCAECHSTGFVKGYDEPSDTYTSTAAHDAVACAACHGPALAPLPLVDAEAQLRACAPCHARRRTLTCGAGPESAFLDHYRPALIDSGAFHPDGGIRAPVEPFEWGPWVQSRMAAAGVRCTDCHDPHAGGLRRAGEATCTGCHPALGDHPSGDCVSCHLPTATYMGVHVRHDHHVRRPGDAGQAAVFGPALAGDPAAVSGLLAVATDPRASAFDRASALALLRPYPPAGRELVRPLVADPDPLVRVEAVATLGAWGDADAARRGLDDPVRAVRLAALEAFVTAGGDARSAGAAFARALGEAEAIGACHDDLPSTWQNLGRLRAAAGDRAGAVAAFRALQRRAPGDAAAARALRALGEAP